MLEVAERGKVRRRMRRQDGFGQRALDGQQVRVGVGGDLDRGAIRDKRQSFGRLPASVRQAERGFAAAHDQEVVDQAALLVEEAATLSRSRPGRGHIARQHPVEDDGRVRATHVDHAVGRNVQEARSRAHGNDFVERVAGVGTHDAHAVPFAVEHAAERGMAIGQRRPAGRPRLAHASCSSEGTGIAGSRRAAKANGRHAWPAATVVVIGSRNRKFLCRSFSDSSSWRNGRNT